MDRPARSAARGGLVVVGAVAGAMLLPGVAAADVTVAASRAEPGARDVTITFRVTNDDPAVPTTRLQVFLPTARPLLGVEPVAPSGWTARRTTAVPASPPPRAGGPATEVVTAVDWAGGPLEGTGYAVFPMDVDRLPEGAGPLRFRVVQTFADGTTVEWSDTVPYGAPAPAHPALVVPYSGTSALPAEPGHHHGAPAEVAALATRDAGSPGRWVVGLVGAVAAVVAAAAAALGRRQRRRLAEVWAAPPDDPDRATR